jgi:hypothetical protein
MDGLSRNYIRTSRTRVVTLVRTWESPRHGGFGTHRGRCPKPARDQDGQVSRKLPEESSVMGLPIVTNRPPDELHVCLRCWTDLVRDDRPGCKKQAARRGLHHLSIGRVS